MHSSNIVNPWQSVFLTMRINQFVNRLKTLTSTDMVLMYVPS